MATTSEAKIVALPSVIDLDALDMVRDGLIDAVELGDVVIDGAAVERVATNGLLMLISAAETAQRNHNSFGITGASASMLASIDRLGLAESFSRLMKG